MPTLPWTAQPQSPEPDAMRFVLGSRLAAAVVPRRLGFLRAAMSIRRQVRPRPERSGSR